MSFAPLKELRLDFVKVDGGLVLKLLSSDLVRTKMAAIVRSQDRKFAGHLAPASGLCLWEVRSSPVLAYLTPRKSHMSDARTPAAGGLPPRQPPFWRRSPPGNRA